MSKRKPWMKFYPADWQADDGLRQCSLTSRGLWIDMIAVMHKSELYGHLLIAGVNPTVNQIASAVRADVKTVKAAIDELEGWRVFSRTDDGVIYSRRMVSDAEKEERDAENGRGGGNPQLKGGVNHKANGTVNDGVMQGVNPQDNGVDKAQIPEARSQKTEKEEGSLRSPAREDGFEDWWKAYPRKVGKGHAAKAYAKALRKTSAETLLNALKSQTFDTRERFIPHPATWLGGERWLDEVDTFDPALRAAGLSPEDFELSAFEPKGLLQ